MSSPQGRHGSFLHALERRLGLGRSSLPARYPRAWLVYLLLGGAAIVGYAIIPNETFRAAVFLATGAGAVIAALAGVRINRPEYRPTWILVTLGLLLWSLGDVLTGQWALPLGEAASPKLADLIYLVTYLTVATAMLLLVRHRARGRDRATLIDATIVATAFGLLLWILVVKPFMADATLPLLDRLAASAFPAMDVVLLGVAARLAMGPGNRSVSFWLIVLSLTCTLLADVAYALIVARGVDYSFGLLYPMWLCAHLFAGGAALHPSMRDLAAPAEEREETRLTQRRGVLLAAALLVAPSAMAIEWLRGDSRPDVVPIGLGTVGISFLVLARLAGLVRDLRITVAQREQALAELKAADVALRSSERRFRRLVEHAADAFFLHEASGRIVDVNQRACDVLGYTRDELLAMSLGDIEVDFDPEAWNALWGSLVPHVPMTLDGVHRRRDGSSFPVEVRLGLFESGGRPLMLALARDVTERLALEEQLRQSQKMEAVGHLAGGIAHDFNNLLTVITGYSELLLETLGPRDPASADVVEIKKAADRAGGLTRQLLAYSRKQVLQMEVLDLNSVVTGLEPFLARLIGEHIMVLTRLQSGLGPVEADRIQLEQVLLNLAVNARDAMPDGGALTIETADVELDEAYARIHADATPGAHVRLSVRDTGVGMTDEVRERLFLPFFTTKEKGKGTGLGLATVYGVVRQIGGHIAVRSAPGHGSTFSIYLPKAASLPVALARQVPDGGTNIGSETVLIVEDEPAVRALLRGILERHGYRVLEAGHGEAAIALADRHEGPIDLLVTDVIMPGMNGRALAEVLTRSRPGLPVLFISGYTDDVIGPHGILDPGITLLEKPFTAEALTRRVREVLDGRAA